MGLNHLTCYGFLVLLGIFLVSFYWMIDVNTVYDFTLTKNEADIWQNQTISREVVLPKYDKFISTQTSCGRLGNILYRIAILYGIGRVIGRTPVYNSKMKCEMASLSEIHQVFPVLSDFLETASPKENETFFTPTLKQCCNYSAFDKATQKHVVFKPAYYYSYQFFDAYKLEIRHLFRLKSELVEKMKASGERIFGDTHSHNLCIHSRRGDFFTTRFLESQAEFIQPATTYIHSYLNLTSKTSIVLFGDDKSFMKSLYFDRSLFSKVYMPNLNSRTEDMAFALQFCDSFLLSSSASTFGFWIAYLLPEDRQVFYNGDVLRNGTYTDKQFHDFYPEKWVRIYKNKLTISVDFN